MNANPELQHVYDEVLKKIGRNLLMFQQAEQMMKHLLTLGSYTATADEPKSFEELAGVWQKQTMGQLKNPFVDRHCIKTDDPFAEYSPHPEKTSIAISFTLGSSDGYAEARREAIDMLVTERNELVHHLFLKLDRTSLKSCRKIAADLDAQREKALPEIKQLQEDCKGIEELVTFLASDEGRAMLSAGPIQQSSLIQELAAIAGENSDPEGWNSLGAATRQLQDFPQKKIKAICDQFDQKSLTGLLAASQLFDIHLEPTESGHPRVHYRLKATAADSQSKVARPR